MAKASDNIFPLLRLAPGTAPATPAAGSAALFIDSADGSLKTKDSAGVVKAIGSGGGNRDLRWFLPSGSTSIDEFNDDTLDAAWVRVDGTGAAAGNVTWTEKGDNLSVYQAGGDSSAIIHGLMRPLSSFGGAPAVGDAFVTVARIFAPWADYTMSGIVLSDGTTHGAGNQITALAWTGNTGNIAYSAWTGTNWSLSAAGSPGTVAGSEVFVRLVCVSATTWRCDVSPDGISWIVGTTLATKTITPTHVGVLASSFGSATKGVVNYQFLRRVSGVS